MDRFLLAIETCGKSGSVAIVRDDSQFSASSEPIFTGSLALDPEFGSAKTLAPAIDRLLSQNGIAPSQLSCIAVVSGPGSFTGLRVGVATAKVLAYALQVPVVEVDTLDLVAMQVAQIPNVQNLSFNETSLFTVFDAYRGQLFVARYQLTNACSDSTDQTSLRNECYIKTLETTIEDIETVYDWIGSEQTGGVLVAGPGIDRLKKFADFSSLINLHWIPITPDARSVAEIGMARHRKGEYVDALGLLPHYYRASAAEEKRKLEDS